MSGMLTLLLLLGQLDVASDMLDEPVDPFATARTVRAFTFSQSEDLDFDGQPDDWSRRKGSGFPNYVQAEIDRDIGHDGAGGLRFNVNGGAAIYYSPLIDINPHHVYVFEGHIRTAQFQRNAAIISLSILNHKRERVQRLLTAPVTGTHADFVPVRIGPIIPHPEARYAVFGCHLVEGDRGDINGTVWFDGLRIARLPYLQLMTNFQTHFVRNGAPVLINGRVGGLERGYDYRIRLWIENSHGKVIHTEQREVELPETPADHHEFESGSSTISWDLPPREPGFYGVRARLYESGRVIVEQQTNFAILELIDQPREGGEFGWTLHNIPSAERMEDILAIAGQSGINYMKVPVWNGAATGIPSASSPLLAFFERLLDAEIEPIGCLGNPPPELRNKFARDWAGVSEIFLMPEPFWSAAIEQAIARHATLVRTWQIGREEDHSFGGVPHLDRLLDQIKREIDRIGRDTTIGLPWDWEAGIPKSLAGKRTFLSLNHAPSLTADELIVAMDKTSAAGVPRHVFLKPQSKREIPDPEVRATELVRRVVAAKRMGADRIFVGNIFDPDHGLLRLDGSPTELYLPWRTFALGLQNAAPLGTLEWPEGTENFAFSRGGEGVLVAWSEKPQDVEFLLGADVTEFDIRGQRRSVPVNAARRQMIQLEPTPKLFLGCSVPLMEWQLSTGFREDELRSEYGTHQGAVTGHNPFSQGVSGTVRVRWPGNWESEPDEWTIQLGAGERFELPFYLTLPPNTSLGTENAVLHFDVTSDRPYQFDVVRPITVGAGDLSIHVVDHLLPDGTLEIEQVIVNQTQPEETLTLRCHLFVPDQKRQTLIVARLANGEDRKFYHVANGSRLKGRELWIRAEQEGGRRVMNYRWKVGESWNKDVTNHPPGF